ncbi:MAG: PrpF domain-containing protein [Tepidanaerobacteraceae bacterium]
MSPPQTYDTFNNKHIKAEDVDITARLLFMLRVHKTYPGTGTVCTGAAARIHGTVVWDVLREEAKHTRKIRIGHPAGIIEVESQMESADGHFKLTRAAFYRTARRIMEGYVYVKKSILD